MELFPAMMKSEIEPRTFVNKIHKVEEKIKKVKKRYSKLPKDPVERSKKKAEEREIISKLAAMDLRFDLKEQEEAMFETETKSQTLMNGQLKAV